MLFLYFVIAYIVLGDQGHKHVKIFTLKMPTPIINKYILTEMPALQTRTRPIHGNKEEEEVKL